MDQFQDCCKALKSTFFIEKKQLNGQEILIKTALINNSICFINMNIERRSEKY